MKYIPYDGKVRIIFVFQIASFWTSWESLYKECMEDERFIVKLMWIDDISGDAAQMGTAAKFLEEKNIPYEIFNYESIINFQPHYMVYQTPYDKGHRKSDTWTARFRRCGIRIVYIPYGIEISDTTESRYKHFSLAVVLNAFNIYVLSQAMKNEYEKYCVNAKAARALGLPRFDNLKHKERFLLDNELIRRVKGRKIILWKTHFPKVFVENSIKKQATPRLEEYLKFLSYIEDNKNLFFIFMPHPKFTDGTIDDSLRPMAVELLKKLQVLENVYIDQSDDSRYSLVNANAIIVDRSAVMVEAGAVGVPVLYMYNNDYNEPMSPPIQKLLDSFCQGTTAHAMVKFCESCQLGIDEKREEREAAFAGCVPYFDGRCANRIKENLLSEVKEDCPNEIVDSFPENCRILIFGTGDISGICMEVWSENHTQLPIDIVAFVDNNVRKQGCKFWGKPTISPAQVIDIEYDYIVIASDVYFNSIYLQVTEELKVPKEKVITFDQFIVLIRFSGDINTMDNYKDERRGNET